MPYAPPKHRPPQAIANARQLAADRPGSQWANSYRWQKARKAFIVRNPLCKRCGAPATVVDHIKPHKGSYELFWDPTNFQPLCKPCHDRKTATENLASGAFMSGKED